jgi:hypothetical protein
VVAAAVGVEGRGGVEGEGVAVAVAGGADSVTGGEIGVEIGGVSLAGVVVEEEVGVAHLAGEVVTWVETDGAVVSALLELDVMSCCPPFLSNITRFFCVCTDGDRGGVYSVSFGGAGGSRGGGHGGGADRWGGGGGRGGGGVTAGEMDPQA